VEMAEQQVVEQVVEQQLRTAPAGRRPAPPGLSTRMVGAVRSAPVGTHVLPLGPGSRFARLHWGGQCVNCGEAVHPGERGWIDPTDTEVLCVACWPPLMIGWAGHSAALG
jgi:hypothetical protein